MPGIASTGVIMNPASDFGSGLTGPQTPDLDVTSLALTTPDASTLPFVDLLAGNFETTAGGSSVFEVNRSQGTSALGSDSLACCSTASLSFHKPASLLCA